MGFTVIELQEMRRKEKSGESPTDCLLQIWGQQNNKITKLWLFLYKMRHSQAMRVIMPFSKCIKFFYSSALC